MYLYIYIYSGSLNTTTVAQSLKANLEASLLFFSPSVCNGDYGDTSFHGVNEILVFGDSITASVAKLNEFYMATASEARKQYTVCHGELLPC